jgi:hypothetical protein
MGRPMVPFRYGPLQEFLRAGCVDRTVSACNMEGIVMSNEG